MSHPPALPQRSRCSTFPAGWPSQAWSTRKLERTGGHCIGANPRILLPIVVAQTTIPRRERSARPANGENGRTRVASDAVAATIDEGWFAGEVTTQPDRPGGEVPPGKAH